MGRPTKAQVHSINAWLGRAFMKVISSIIIILLVISSASARPRMLITIDDGPNEHTHKILSCLNAEGYRAVFFVSGTGGYRNGRNNIIKFTNVLREIIEDGHIVGNHTKSHDLEMLRGGTHQEVLEDMKWINDFMCKHYDYQVDLFRPPFGLQRKHVFPKWCKKLELQSMMWTIDIGDSAWWKKPFNVSIIEKRVVKGMQAHSWTTNHIVLMHSIAAVSRNIEKIMYVLEKYGDPIRQDEDITVTGERKYTVQHRRK
jgi:peptidoglycan/xylan/chitin deacetylase (PgdA/CDA1 family)